MDITISNAKKLANGHEGERVCSAVVLIDGVPFATAADSPYGALMQFETISLPESDFITKLQEIESELGKEIINHPQGFKVVNSLHLVVNNLIREQLIEEHCEKEYK